MSDRGSVHRRRIREIMLAAVPLSAMMAGGIVNANAAEKPAPAAGTFVSKAATGGMEEVNLAELALSKSHNPDVDKFAKKMKHDHTQANAELKSIAKKDSIKVPSTLTPEQQKKVAALKAKDGDAFDKAYAKTMLQAHEKAVALFKSASTDASKPDLRKFATDTLPVLQGHLKMAQALEAGMSGAK